VPAGGTGTGANGGLGVKSGGGGGCGGSQDVKPAMLAAAAATRRRERFVMGVMGDLMEY
jgi:hypothetical protein